MENHTAVFSAIPLNDQVSRLLEAEAGARGMTANKLLNSLLQHYLTDPSLAERPEFLALRHSVSKLLFQAGFKIDFTQRNPNLAAQIQQHLADNPALALSLGENLARFLKLALQQTV